MNLSHSKAKLCRASLPHLEVVHHCKVVVESRGKLTPSQGGLEYVLTEIFDLNLKIHVSHFNKQRMKKSFQVQRTVVEKDSQASDAVIDSTHQCHTIKYGQ